MNRKNMTLAMAAMVAAVAVTAVAFAVPQQALAHSGHHHNSGVKVNQQIDQANLCSNNTLCLNNGNNTVDIDR